MTGSSFFPGHRQGWLRSLVALLIGSALFGLAHTQWPLYVGKQHTKFLHGLAAAGLGELRGDWLAQTLDPLPLFSGLVFITQRFLDPVLFYVYQALLLGVYLAAILCIVGKVSSVGRSPAGSLAFVALFLGVYSTLLPPFNTPIFGSSLGWLLQSGVADQYLLNPSFEPGSFGVLLFVSLCAFLAGRPYWAASLAAAATLFHSAYLLAAAVLVACYAAITLWEERRWLKSIGIGLTALAVVLPGLLYNSWVLGPTTPESWQQAQDIIVYFRIPHHSLPELWVDDAVYFQLGVVVLGTLLAWRTRLFPILVASLAVAVGLTWLQTALDSTELAFLAPWRLSVYLVPLATAILLAKGVGWASAALDRAWPDSQVFVAGLSVIFVLLLALKGAVAIQDSQRARAEDPRQPLWQFVRGQVQAGDVYVVPSAMAEFRLETGAPVVITYKSHPYKDTEILAWYERLQAVDAFYQEPTCERLDQLITEYGATDVVLPAEQSVAACDRGQEVYRDGQYSVVQVRGP